MKLDDVCALPLCGHIRGEHGTEGRPFEPLSRQCLVEGCPCARFVEPRPDDEMVRVDPTHVVPRGGLTEAEVAAEDPEARP